MKIRVSEQNLSKQQLDKQFGENPYQKHLMGGKVVGYTIEGQGFNFNASVTLPHHASYERDPIAISVDYQVTDGSLPLPAAIVGAGEYVTSRILRELKIDIRSNLPSPELIQIDLEGRVSGAGAIGSGQGSKNYIVPAQAPRQVGPARPAPKQIAPPGRKQIPENK